MSSRRRARGRGRRDVIARSDRDHRDDIARSGRAHRDDIARSGRDHRDVILWKATPRQRVETEMGEEVVPTSWKHRAPDAQHTAKKNHAAPNT